jgi:hypothetical protein
VLVQVWVSATPPDHAKNGAHPQMRTGPPATRASAGRPRYAARRSSSIAEPK